MLVSTALVTYVVCTIILNYFNTKRRFQLDNSQAVLILVPVRFKEKIFEADKAAEQDDMTV